MNYCFLAAVINQLLYNLVFVGSVTRYTFILAESWTNRIFRLHLCLLTFFVLAHAHALLRHYCQYPKPAVSECSKAISRLLSAIEEFSRVIGGTTLTLLL